MIESYFDGISCHKDYVLAVKDTLNVVSGKWKLAIVCSLFHEKKRFSEIERMIPPITPRMLSKELRELEVNGVIVRNVITSMPIVIEYDLTLSGRELRGVVDKMVEWGLLHRQATISELT
ncbi:helix-turn-helix domain-containing protein [Pedobacter sp. MC2016-24]|uniref:winged helix-turn-helix transcriptional regulator n=1 Tax=Pedobacter sp. MC2016-24 TaxID=2780090 RepID=UPI00188090D3|nr:helix-turn-helix domain-containing protein [Pedobacter sp. MC2016-24]MBE9599855.1 helix-turn-helix transcriptional regulator [Pedobacter sp. MC2016-24]